MKPVLRSVSEIGRRAVIVTLVCNISTFAQDARPVSGGDAQVLNGKIEVLTRSLEQTQTELARSRMEIAQLRSTLEEVLKRIDSAAAAMAPGGAKAGSDAKAGRTDEATPAAQITQDDWEVLTARVEEQRQTKVESGSKFRLRLSGLALFNAFDGSGQVDNLDLPSIAVKRFPGYSAGGGGASLRQSIVGLAGVGPMIFGARTSADLQMGFYGGLPSGYTATSSGIANLRIARVRFDWENTSVVAGLDTPFFSPNLPTTYTSVAVPGLASAGNLWTWTPGVRVEHRFAGALSGLKLEAGMLDPSSNVNYATSTNLRTPTPAESSRIPTYAFRASFGRKSEGGSNVFGIGGVYSPQEFFGGYRQDGWAATADWKFQILPRTEVSGQFFTGRGIDGFGGIPENPYPLQNQFLYTTVTARLLADIGAIGGWSQVKFKWNAQNEFNVAAGSGGRNSAGLRLVIGSTEQPLIPARNQTLFANYIFRPRSDLLFSAEYKRFRTYQVNGLPDIAEQIGLAVGFLF